MPPRQRRGGVEEKAEGASRTASTTPNELEVANGVEPGVGGWRKSSRAAWP